MPINKLIHDSFISKFQLPTSNCHNIYDDLFRISNAVLYMKIAHSLHNTPTICHMRHSLFISLIIVGCMPCVNGTSSYGGCRCVVYNLLILKYKSMWTVIT